MIVEFIGSTGAGKTTLIAEVQRSLSEGPHAAVSVALAEDLFGAGRVKHPTLRNVTQDVCGLPYFLGSLYRHRAFFTFALSMLARHKRSRLSTANYIRSVIRKIGTYEFVKRRERDRIVLVDEGTVLAAHLLFVFTNKQLRHTEIEKFARLVPLPDLVIYVKAPIDRLVERSLHRVDVRREMRSQDPMQVENYVRRAAETFDRLTETKAIRDRVLIVANSDSTESERRVVADQIAAYINQYRPHQELPHRRSEKPSPLSIGSNAC